MKALAAAALVSAVCAGCATLSVDEARRITTRFQDQPIAPPPRTIADIVRSLETIAPAPDRLAEQRAGADAQPITSSDAALAQFYRRRGLAAWDLGRTEQFLDDLRRAGRHADAARLDYRELRRVLIPLAFAEMEAANFNTGLETLRRAMAIQPTVATTAADMAARFYAMVGDVESARSYEDWISRNIVGASTTDPPPRWRFSAVRIWPLHAEGRWADAEPHIREAIRMQDIQTPGEVTPSPGDRLRLARVLAENVLAQRRLAEAETLAREALRRALALYGRHNPHTVEAVALVGRVLSEQGRFDDAERLARIGLGLLDDAGMAVGSLTRSGHLHTLGGVLVAQRKWPEAIATFDRARTGIRDAELYERLYGRGLDAPLAYAYSGRAAEAVRLLAAALDFRRRTLPRNHSDTAETQAVLAVARKRAGDREGALADFLASVPSLVAHGRAGDGSGARERRLRLIVGEYLDLLGERRQPGAVQEALQLAEAARGRNVQRALAAAATRAAARDQRLADLVRQEQDARRHIAVLEARSAAFASAAAAERPAALVETAQARLAELRAAHDTLQREIARTFPEYAALMNPAPPSVADVQTHLQPGESVVVLHSGHERTFVWAIPARGPVAFAPAAAPTAQLRDWVATLRRALDLDVRTVGDIAPFDTAVAHRLYAAVLAPVEDGWRSAQTLIVVPDGPLAQLPFALLVTQPKDVPPSRSGAPLFAPYRDVPWLARQVAIVQVPSVSALVTLRSLSPTSAPRRPFVGFGDPWFAARQAQRAPVSARAADVARRTAPATRTVDSAQLAMLPPLPETAEEVRQIARVLGADPERDVFLGREASEHVVRSTDLSDRRVVMFATHGLVPGDLDGLTEPALALTAPSLAGTPGDGLLTLGKILGLRLNADWVVLSACNTAAAEGAGAEAVSGLGRAFLYAGTRAVLVSNWAVETTSAAALTTEIFRRQAASPGLAGAEALRQAMLGLMDGPGLVRDGRTLFSYAHPVFWAPFSLVGDNRGQRSEASRDTRDAPR